MSTHVDEDLAGLSLGDAALTEKHAAHLAGCEDCRRALAEAKAVMAALDAPALEPSMGFDRALFAKLDALDAPSPLARLWAFLTPPQWALAGAAALGVAALAVRMGPSGEEPMPAELAALEDEVAENLEMLSELELVEDLDVAEDLDAILALEEGTPG